LILDSLTADYLRRVNYFRARLERWLGTPEASYVAIAVPGALWLWLAWHGVWREVWNA
jgi:hypothetical protein